MENVPIPVCAASPSLAEAAQALAAKVDGMYVRSKPQEGLALALDEDGLVLSNGALSLRGGFEHMKPRLQSGKLQRELVVRACKLKGFEGAQNVVDATAGLGEDSFLLAATGMEVQLFEANPVIAALLEDALRRAAADSVLAPIAARMHLTCGDSVDALSHMHLAACDDASALPRTQADVVLLDPMFPGRKKSAAVKKKLQLIQQLEQPCSDEDALFDAALTAGPERIVVKRPAKGPYLAGRTPSYSLTGKAIRFDCYV